MLERLPELGYPLRGEWAGAVRCTAAMIDTASWRILEPIEDYEGQTDLVVPVAILRIGPKTDRRGRTIYERAAPSS